MMLLTLSISALFLGPLLYRLIARNSNLMSALDAFIFVVIGGVVLFHMLPDILQVGGIWSLAFLALGLAVPTILEHTFHAIARHAHAGALLFAALGLGFHGMTDGAALAEATTSDHQSLLAAGVILHRLPVGLTIWWLLRPHFGAVVALLVLAGISVATVFGHQLAEPLLHELHGPGIAWFEALVVGTILHVVFHRPYHEDHNHQGLSHEGHSHQGHQHAHHHDHRQSVQQEPTTDWLQGVGSLLGVVVLLAIMVPYWLGTIEHQHGHHDDHGHHHAEVMTPPLADHSSAEVLHRLLDLSLAVAPWLLLAYLLAATINFLLPTPFATPRKQDDGDSPVMQSIRGAIAGLPLPICVPNASRLYNLLLQNGAGQTYALAFLIASPLLGIDALLLTWGLLGAEWTLWRLVVTFVFSMVMALAIGYWLRQSSSATEVSQHTDHPSSATDKPAIHWRTRMQQAVRHGYAHLIDHTAPWVITGLIVAALLPSVTGLNELPILPTLLVLAMLSLPLHICATGMTPLLAVLLMAGLAPEVALILLLLGPVTNLTQMKLLSRLHGKRSAQVLTLSMVLCALAMTQLMPYWPSETLTFEHNQHADHWWQYVALVAITLLYTVSLLRRGARAFVAELLPTNNGHHHKHH
ncbi:permease [Neiella sp. HB171785]|uniref:Permease n=1 Tax=Neiella litorisoli TaxID=2771431 RepID=A0A8J6QTD7_9GAMM|nr:permease [Neiella litorisoli]MBD1387883.1 permease [Neiella litorisoli]